MIAPEQHIEWWENSKVGLVVYDAPVVFGDIPTHVCSLYDSSRAQLFELIKAGFAARDSMLGHAEHSHNPPVILHPVYLDLSANLFRELVSAPNESTFRSLCTAGLPEAERPFVFTHGKADVGNGLNPNFLNVLFLRAEQWPISQFSTDRKVWFMQSMMAKMGSFKNLFVLCSTDGIERAYLSSLEGGHPFFEKNDLDELVRRLRVFGSAQKAAVDFEFSDVVIPEEVWATTPSISHLRKLGALAEQFDLLSPPVSLKSLVKNQGLGSLLERLVRYSRQAEGAMLTVDPVLSRRLGIDNPVAVLSVSGRFGAVKTDLHPEDLIAVEIDVNRGSLRRLHVGVSDDKEPSVEGMEFLAPLSALARDFPVRVRLHEQGIVATDDADVRGIVVPPVRGIFHMHRDVLSGGPVFDHDVRVYPPVGCGVDLMEYISAHGFRRVVTEWDASGRVLPRGLIRVANHGMNDTELWTPNDRGMYPLDPFEDFRSQVSHRLLQFTRDIPQL